MPNRKSHTVLGVTAGAAYSLYLSDNQKPEDRVMEMIGGILGGCLGGRLPDVLEPATRNPRHRAFAHSLVIGTASSMTANKLAVEWTGHFRKSADRIALERQRQPLSDAERLLSVSLEMFLRVAAGVGPGLIAGYISHLYLDAGTPRSLPLI